jgi:hypothetical protein
MTAPEGYLWRRDKDGLGIWEHRGKVAAAGVGHSPVDRHWDEVSMDKMLGAYRSWPARRRWTKPGVTPDPVDGEVTCEEVAPGQLIHEWQVVA